MLETENKGTTFFQNISNYWTVEHHITYQKNVSSQALMYNTKSSPRTKASNWPTYRVTYSMKLQNSTKKKIVKEH
jgi:hypothetical protein